MAALKKEISKGPRTRGSTAQVVYENLKTSILDLSLTPGSPLDEVSLSEQFDMSRTPIREALVRLVAEGLVKTLPNRNTVVAAIEFEQLPVYFEALTLMYRVTTRAAALHRDDSHLSEIRAFAAGYVDAVEGRDALAMIEANRNFHMAIARAGGNPYFTSLFDRLLDEGRRILRLYYQSFDDQLPQQYVQEHSAMITAIEVRDADRADTLAAGHAAQIVKQIQSYINREGVSGAKLTDREK
jgi:DNA-binding GntR family transcriptional regulator